MWNSLSLVSPFRPVRAQRCRVSSGTNRSKSYYIERCSHCLSGDKSRDMSCECRLLCRQQSRLYQPAWIVDAWLCSSGQPCSTGFQWTKWRRQKRLSVCKMTAEMRTYKKKNYIGKLTWTSSVAAVTVYFNVLFWWWGRHILIDEKRCFCCDQEHKHKRGAAECYLWDCDWLLMPVILLWGIFKSIG